MHRKCYGSENSFQQYNSIKRMACFEGVSNRSNVDELVTIKITNLIITIVTVLAKTRHVRTKTEFNFIAAVYRHTQYLSIPSVSSVKC